MGFLIAAAGTAVEVNDEGFLTDFADWTPEIGQALAAAAGIGRLNDGHWRLVLACRESAARGRYPDLKSICRRAGIDREDLDQLFPGGADQLTRIAGLNTPQVFEGSFPPGSLAPAWHPAGVSSA